MPDRDVIVCEVGPRDGLQLVPQFVPTPVKKQWIAAECAAGVPEIEVTSFVPAKLLPQFADADEIARYALTLPELTVTVLVPNRKGAERAFETGAQKVNYVLSASESHNQANVRRSSQDSLQDFRNIVELRGQRQIRLGGTISTSFGCTIEGAIAEDTVVNLAEKYLEYGADQITIADTVGFANPMQVKRMFTRLRRLGMFEMSAHFHDTRGLGLANVYAALEAGIRRFDSTLGGMGGCPYAPGATGNIVTEDLVFLLEGAGLRTGIDIHRLVMVRKIVEAALPDEPLHGAISRAGLPKGFVPA